MNNILPVIGANVLPPLDEFQVVVVPVLLLEYLAAHGHDDAAPSQHDDMIEVTQRYQSALTGSLVVYRMNIGATMPAVRLFLGYPA